ncbi:S1C family serine protease [Moraxella nasicaprae]|uniref:Trypsin-like peptidase domain-containing protein n=1 Tax=Moraxella nasicaprae TaxID=2904122 RepID=A0ABY6F4K8_9GAMM|nr:trypsin-like peptidase domain-containing protein [Moraxella nasicaprae]UXZ05026.1 trypsin-like peptidase domain-containing protein [Moraxella nasicaprae]
MKHTNPNQQMGLSAWILLPWLICIALVAIMWFVYPQVKQLQTSNAPQADTSSEQAWQPKIANQDNNTNPDTPEPISSYHQAVNKAAQSVVNIYTTQQIAQHPYANDPFFSQFFEQLPKEGGHNLGSGVIVSKDGYIVTNAHVIAKADEITVILNDGRKAKASIIGSDEDSDLAVIKVQMNGLIPMEFRSKPIKVGDVALAIGNPFGVGQTVTQGIVSATGRMGIGVSRFEDFIQTDAAINPGNSGGALVDANGALIGVNTAIYSRSGGSMGIGFAIPNTMVEQVMNALIKDGKVSRGWIGVELAIHQDSAIPNDEKGLLVANVMPNSPAAQAGIQRGDVLLSIDGTPLSSANALVNLVANKAPGSQLNVEIERQGQALTVLVVPVERPNLEQLQGTRQNNPPANQAQVEELLRQLEQLQNR